MHSKVAVMEHAAGLPTFQGELMCYSHGKTS